MTKKHQVTPDEADIVWQVVERRFGASRRFLVRPTRLSKLYYTEVRRIAIYLAYVGFNSSLRKTGIAMGCSRNTVKQSIEHVDHMREDDPEFNAFMLALFGDIEKLVLTDAD